MKKTFIIGNWKSYKNSEETREWFERITNYKLPVRQAQAFGSEAQARRGSEFIEERITNEKEIILCVPFTVLALAKSFIEECQLPVTLGVQDISPFGEGKYTGEINGRQIAEFANYVIIGHSERRQYFGEDEEMIGNKIEQAVSCGLTPIVCVSEAGQVHSSQFIHNSQMIIAYEPLFAIGSGQADSPENANRVSAEIQEEMENVSVIYGGSVTSKNVHSFTAMPNISGVLPGGASLDAEEFVALITNA